MTGICWLNERVRRSEYNIFRGKEGVFVLDQNTCHLTLKPEFVYSCCLDYFFKRMIISCLYYPSVHFD